MVQPGQTIVLPKPARPAPDNRAPEAIFLTPSMERRAGYPAYQPGFQGTFGT
jgi:hypothetical protein